MSTVLIVLGLALAVFAATKKIYKDKKSGKTCCGGSDCAICAKRQKNNFM